MTTKTTRTSARKTAKPTVTQADLLCGGCENGECDNCGNYPCCAETNQAKVVETVEVPAACRCGCGQSVGRRATYRPGHDARHAAAIARAAAAKPETWEAEENYEDLLSAALRAKARKSAALLLAKAAKAEQKANADKTENTEEN